MRNIIRMIGIYAYAEYVWKLNFITSDHEMPIIN